MALRMLTSCLRLTLTQTTFTVCARIQLTAQRCIVTTSSQQIYLKRPPTPYAIFVKDKFPEIQEKHPDEPAKEIFGKLAEEWWKVSAAEKKKYEDIFSKSKEEYEEQKAKLTVEEKQELLQQMRRKRMLRSKRRLGLQWHRTVEEYPELQAPKRPPSQIIYTVMKLGIFKSINQRDWQYYLFEFKKLSDSKREALERLRQQEIQEYRIKKGEWIQRMVLLENPYANSLLSSVDIKKELKRLGKPSRPATSFFGFLRAHEMERGNRTVTEFTKDMKRLWQDISEEEKEMYKDEFLVEKENYAIAVADWKNDLADLGKTKSVMLMEKVLNSRRQKRGGVEDKS